MADRVSASIRLGGAITAADYAELSQLIADEGLSAEWDGPPFAPDHRVLGEPLCLYAHEVAWGCFDALEAWCVGRKTPFVRWSGAYAGQWGAERVVFTGEGEPTSYAVDEEDYVVIDRGTVQTLGSADAILAYFDAADVTIPALSVEGDPSNVPDGTKMGVPRNRKQ
ncbi:MAG: hypothetical protein ABS75_32480 [Pelagibacterium sp. SCN 63-23]|nr:MAG: hypothetical protein ABS75_32480 [Pelagibacterium sp. SCN 63-23]